MHAPTRIRVSGSRSYDVVVGAGVLAELPALSSGALGRLPGRALIVVDSGARAHAGDGLERAGVRVSRVEITPSEAGKSLDTFGRLMGAALDAGLDRADAIIAVGGGIVGDVAGFAAASYRRGVAFIACPTTLLAMVDASIGGKTGVNLTDSAGRLLKNMAGAFHPPWLVVADLCALATLPARVFRAGLGECVKHALLEPSGDGGSRGLGWLEGRASAIAQAAESPDRAAGLPEVRELIEHSVRLKARVVGGDEREDPDDSTGRATLNLGHTYAHAIETIGGLRVPGWSEPGVLMHGEAVGLGLIAACRASAAAGMAEPALEDRTRDLLAAVGLPTEVSGLPDDAELLARMGSDKKVIGVRRRLVLPLAGGGARVVDGLTDAVVLSGWSAIRAGG